MGIGSPRKESSQMTLAHTALPVEVREPGGKQADCECSRVSAMVSGKRLNEETLRPMEQMTSRYLKAENSLSFGPVTDNVRGCT